MSSVNLNDPVCAGKGHHGGPGCCWDQLNLELGQCPCVAVLLAVSCCRKCLLMLHLLKHGVSVLLILARCAVRARHGFAGHSLGLFGFWFLTLRYALLR